MVFGVVADISTKEGRQVLMDKAKDLFGLDSEGEKLHILVNNVGTNIRKPTCEYTHDDLSFILNTNFVSMFELSKLCHPYMKGSGSDDDDAMSSIVNIGSGMSRNTYFSFVHLFLFILLTDLHTHSLSMTIIIPFSSCWSNMY